MIVPASFLRNITALTAGIDDALIDQPVTVIIIAVTNFIDRVAVMSRATVVNEPIAIVIDSISADFGNGYAALRSAGVIDQPIAIVINSVVALLLSSREDLTDAGTPDVINAVS